jgi:hypothetical protein
MNKEIKQNHQINENQPFIYTPEHIYKMNQLRIIRQLLQKNIEQQKYKLSKCYIDENEYQSKHNVNLLETPFELLNRKIYLRDQNDIFYCGNIVQYDPKIKQFQIDMGDEFYM